jgi:MYXO-CTERM domain-containing protein
VSQNPNGAPQGCNVAPGSTPGGLPWEAGALAALALVGLRRRRKS